MSGTVPLPLAAALAAARDPAADAAERAARAAVDALPNDPRAHALLARALLRGNRVEEARAAVASGLALDPGSIPLLVEQLALARRARATAEVVTIAERLATLAPHHAAFWFDYGMALLDAREARRAAIVLARALAIEPGNAIFADAELNALRAARAPKGELLASARRFADAVGGAYGKALFGIELYNADEHDAAFDAFDAARVEEPDAVLARWISMQIPRVFPHPDEAAEQSFHENWRASLTILEASDLATVSPAEAGSTLLASTAFYVHYLERATRSELERSGRLVTRLAERACTHAPALTLRPQPSKRLRIGFCSATLRKHTVVKLFRALIEQIDRAAFEIVLIHPDEESDAVTDALRSRADHYIGARFEVNLFVARIEALALDALVYLDIGMHGATQTLAALRLAPVQVVLWGHPITTGLPAIDWFLTSDLMEPHDGDSAYSEKLFRLPRLGTCYTMPRRSERLPAEWAGRDPDAVYAFMPQQLQKLPPAFDRALARTAARAPRLKLVMTPFFKPGPIARYRDRLGRAFTAEGIDLEQHLAICRWVENDEFLALAANVDFALDSHRWSGGNTSLEIFAFDTPIVTLPGRTMRSRHTAAMLTLMELPELIARDADHYVEIAVRLASSSEFRAAMRARIAAAKHRLYDDIGVVDAFARFITAEVARARDQNGTR